MFAGLMSRWTIPLRMRGIQRVGNLDGEPSRTFRFQSGARDAVLQRHTVQKLHDDEGLAVLLADLVNGADIRMVQCGSGLGFALKTRQRLRVSGNVFGQEFEGDKAVQPSVFGFVDHAHPRRRVFR